MSFGNNSGKGSDANWSDVNRVNQSNAATGKSEKPWMTVLKDQVSLLDVAAGEGFHPKKRGGKHFICCPNRSEKTPSCVVSERGFNCFGCGAKGNIYAFIRIVRPFLDSDRSAFDYLRDNYGQGINFKKSAENFVKRPLPAREQVLDPVLKKESLNLTMNEVQELHEKFIAGEGMERERSYALRRGWFPADLCGVNLYPLGVIEASEKENSFLAQHNALCFPKLVQTRRVALMYGAEDEFDRRGGQLCVGLKKRLLPETLRAFKRFVQETFDKPQLDNDIRWLWQTGASAKLPWEFDANDNAPVLFITEGPGDGLRLFYEAHRDPVRHENCGSRWHITATDAAAMWCEQVPDETKAADEHGNTPKKLAVNPHSLPVREFADESEIRKISFFDGYQHIILVLDPDKAGQEAAHAIADYAVRCNDKARIRNLILPNGGDLCQFFDDGYTLEELSDLIADCPVYERAKPLNTVSADAGQVTAPSLGIH